MSVQVRCPNPSCGMNLPASAQAGDIVRCPGCGHSVRLAPATLQIPPGPATQTAETHAPEVTPSCDVVLAPGAPAELPRQIGRFIIRARLGAGAFATVYRAHDPQLDREVALKVPHPGTLDTPQCVERFLGEAKAAARLRHAHIVPVYEAGRDGSTYYIASAFIEGQTLAQLLQEVPLSTRRAVEVVRQLAEALAYAHRLGVVHRDVKPANVLMDEEGNAYLTDFGLAYRLDAATRLTQQGAIMGTPAYMAPEQATGEPHEPNPASDQYSLGAILYQLLSGEPRFRGTVQAIFYHLLHSEPIPPRQRNPQVPAELDRICMKSLAREPQQRYGSCQEMAADLSRWLDAEEEPVIIQQPAPRKWPKILLGWSIAVAAVAMVAAAIALSLHFNDKRQADRGTVAVIDPPPTVPPTTPKVPPTTPRAPPSSSKPLPRTLRVVPSTPPQRIPPPLRPPTTRPIPAPPSPPPAPLDCTSPDGVSAAAVRRAQEAWAEYLGRQVQEKVEIGNGVTMTFVLIPPGKFRMGSPEEEDERDADERLHEARLTQPFDLAQTELTQAQYQALMGSNPSHFQDPDRPVESVNWNDASGYAARLTKKLGGRYVYRLPTEAEWEYACRAGRRASMPFGVGDGPALSSRDANFNGRFPYGGAAVGPARTSTSRVASFQANALGLYDMHGNVWEYCADWRAGYPRGLAIDPTGPAKGSLRVRRGGCWRLSAGRCRAAIRGWSEPDDEKPGDYEGFRLARSIRRDAP